MLDAILQAMRADAIPAGVSGRWSVVKQTITPAQAKVSERLEKQGMCKAVPAGAYTHLYCQTMEKMMERPAGDVVMNDFPDELRKHLQFILHAKGKVLVTGMGLGCVVRGLLARGRVESIDLVERSPDVLKLCGASVVSPLVRVHKHDAVPWAKATDGRWDFAWHDLFSDPERDEPHLQVIHAGLIASLSGKVAKQGAWAMPRWFLGRGGERVVR